MRTLRDLFAVRQPGAALARRARHPRRRGHAGSRSGWAGGRCWTAIDLTAHAGEVVALVGPNGAGKSTLLAALAADLAPGSGEVLIGGRPARAWTAPELALRRSVLPQSAVLSFPFPVEDVVRMGRAPWAGTELRGRGRHGGGGGDGRHRGDPASPAARSPRSRAASGPGWRSPGCWPSGPR